MYKSFLQCVATFLVISTPVLADDYNLNSSSTRNDAAGTATDTGSITKNLGGGYSAGGYSTTTTTGGYNTGGSGQAIPDNTRDSRQDTSNGIMLQKRF